MLTPSQKLHTQGPLYVCSEDALFSFVTCSNEFETQLGVSWNLSSSGIADNTLSSYFLEECILQFDWFLMKAGIALKKNLPSCNVCIQCEDFVFMTSTLPSLPHLFELYAVMSQLGTVPSNMCIVYYSKTTDLYLFYSLNSW